MAYFILCSTEFTCVYTFCIEKYRLHVLFSVESIRSFGHVHAYAYVCSSAGAGAGVLYVDSLSLYLPSVRTIKRLLFITNERDTSKQRISVNCE